MPDDNGDGFIDIPEDVTPEGEAGDFESQDEKRQRIQNNHELNLIATKKGWIGKFTGSTNDSTNNGVFILFIGLLLLSIFGGIDIFRGEQISTVTDNLFKFILAVAGYVFGTNAKRD